MFETCNASTNTAAACWMPPKSERRRKRTGCFSEQHHIQHNGLIVPKSERDEKRGASPNSVTINGWQ